MVLVQTQRNAPPKDQNHGRPIAVARFESMSETPTFANNAVAAANNADRNQKPHLMSLRIRAAPA